MRQLSAKFECGDPSAETIDDWIKSDPRITDFIWTNARMLRVSAMVFSGIKDPEITCFSGRMIKPEGSFFVWVDMFAA